MAQFKNHLRKKMCEHNILIHLHVLETSPTKMLEYKRTVKQNIFFAFMMFFES